MIDFIITWAPPLLWCIGTLCMFKAKRSYDNERQILIELIKYTKKPTELEKE